jgi:hypothetical protein
MIPPLPWCRQHNHFYSRTPHHCQDLTPYLQGTIRRWCRMMLLLLKTRYHDHNSCKQPRKSGQPQYCTCQERKIHMMIRLGGAGTCPQDTRYRALRLQLYHCESRHCTGKERSCRNQQSQCSNSQGSHCMQLCRPRPCTCPLHTCCIQSHHRYTPCYRRIRRRLLQRQIPLSKTRCTCCRSACLSLSCTCLGHTRRTRNDLRYIQQYTSTGLLRCWPGAIERGLGRPRTYGWLHSHTYPQRIPRMFGHFHPSSRHCMNTPRWRHWQPASQRTWDKPRTYEQLDSRTFLPHTTRTSGHCRQSIRHCKCTPRRRCSQQTSESTWDRPRTYAWPHFHMCRPRIPRMSGRYCRNTRHCMNSLKWPCWQ